MSERPLPTTPTRVRELLAEHGLEPSRALGQNFLVDANLAARIVRLASVEPGDRVVEIGAGVGALTIALTDVGALVTAIELDRRLVPLLEDVVAGRAVEIVTADALRVDWSNVLTAARWKMVSNLPYNVAVPVVLRLLREAPQVVSMLVMVQREVGARLAAAVGDEAYGAVSVKVALRADAHVVARVPPSVFVPRPRVESALVQIVRRDAPPVSGDLDEIETLVEAGFATRRKTLRNALRPLMGSETDAVLAAAEVPADLRAERVTLDQWSAIATARR